MGCVIGAFSLMVGSLILQSRVIRSLREALIILGHVSPIDDINLVGLMEALFYSASRRGKLFNWGNAFSKVFHVLHLDVILTLG